MELQKLNQEMRDYQAGFEPAILTDEDVCVCKSNIDSIISYLKKAKTKVEDSIKERNITEAGIWDIELKSVETKRLDQAKVKKVLIDNGGLEEFQTISKSIRLNVRINKERAIRKAIEK